jgi:hypothetical protein
MSLFNATSLVLIYKVYLTGIKLVLMPCILYEIVNKESNP